MSQKKIAAFFGVSIATVSKALNDSHEISIELKKKIKSYAEEIGYKKNYSALALRTKKSIKNIAVIIPNFYNFFFNEVIKGINDASRAYGYNTIVLESNDSIKREKELLDYLLTGIADGLIISPSSETIELESHDHLVDFNKRIPVVLFDKIFEGIKCGKITNDNRNCSYRVTQKLIDIGCRKIGLMSDMYKLNIAKERISGFKTAIQEAGLELKKSDMFFYSQELFYTHQLQIFMNSGYDGLFCMEENSLIKVKNFIARSKSTLFEKLKIVGYYSRKVYRKDVINEVEPNYIYVDQKGYKMGQESLKLLLKRFDNNNNSINELIIIDSEIQNFE
ncbi:MAG: LacI family DNA-binding transcriptional regulator [Flavobacteriaceae bacterium]|nr:LacI family DNA-binding transcriptional regulator [Flavobacteriaceae bacterium]